MTNNAAANDTTEPTTILRGTTFEGASWRAHRYAGNFRVTRTVNAGKRGKTCEVFTVVLPSGGTEETMDSVAPAILWAAREGVSVDTMRAMLADLTLAGWSFSEGAARGIDTPRGTIVVEVDLVDVKFSDTELLARFTAIHGRPNGETFRQDTIVGGYTRKDAARAYQWAQDPTNRARLTAMTLTAFRAEMSAIGVRIS